MFKKNLKIGLLILLLTSFTSLFASDKELTKVDWSFKGMTGKFDRSSLQRGYQVYNEICASCHSMDLLSYRNLGEKGGPEFSIDQVKAIAASFEVTDGPDSQGEMFTRPGRPSDKFVSPYPNVQASTAANGGAYPPDMSVLVKARKGGADYIYSVLMGYEEAPQDFELEDGVYYNRYMGGNKIKMAKPLLEGSVTYADGTETTESQMAIDVTTFLTWASEPHLEARRQIGLKVIMYLIILTILVYLSMRRIWSRINPKE